MKTCPTCGIDVKEHPFVGARNISATRVCDLVLVMDRPRSDGSGRTVTVEVDPLDADAPAQRTKSNNLRWTRPDLVAL